MKKTIFLLLLMISTGVYSADSRCITITYTLVDLRGEKLPWESCTREKRKRRTDYFDIDLDNDLYNTLQWHNKRRLLAVLNNENTYRYMRVGSDEMVNFDVGASE